MTGVMLENVARARPAFGKDSFYGGLAIRTEMMVHPERAADHLWITRLPVEDSVTAIVKAAERFAELASSDQAAHDRYRELTARVQKLSDDAHDTEGLEGLIQQIPIGAAELYEVAYALIVRLDRYSPLVESGPKVFNAIVDRMEAGAVEVYALGEDLIGNIGHHTFEPADEYVVSRGCVDDDELDEWDDQGVVEQIDFNESQPATHLDLVHNASPSAGAYVMLAKQFKDGEQLDDHAVHLARLIVGDCSGSIANYAYLNAPALYAFMALAPRLGGRKDEILEKASERLDSLTHGFEPELLVPSGAILSGSDRSLVESSLAMIADLRNGLPITPPALPLGSLSPMG